MKIAIAGGTGQVAQEVIDALKEADKYELLVLSRSVNTQILDLSGVIHRAVAYDNKQDLVEALRGVHTIISFIQVLSDDNQTSQKNLIDAAVQAGVKRFAPSEYGSDSLDHMSWWIGKEKIRKYLTELNRDEMVLEYTLFQPGLFLEYLAFPYQTAKYLQPLQTVFDFEKGRAIVVQGHEDAVITFTSVADLAAMIVKAVGVQERWPTKFGIRGNRLTFRQVVNIGERVRSQPFDIEHVQIEDLVAGKLTASWGLEAKHAAVSNDEADRMLVQVAIGLLLSSVDEAWDVGDDANKLFPKHTFVAAEDYLLTTWAGKT